MESKPNLLHPSKADLNLAVENDSDEIEATARPAPQGEEAPLVEPTTEMSSPEPAAFEAEAPPEEHFLKEVTSDEPVMEVPKEAPADVAPVEEPTKAEAVKEPAEAAAVEKSAEPTPVEEPTETPAVETPAEAAPLEEPTESVPVEEPGDAAAVENQAEAAPVEEPGEAAAVENQAEAAPVEEPVEAAPVEEPTEVTPVEEPAEAAPMEASAEAALIKEPVEADPGVSEPTETRTKTGNESPAVEERTLEASEENAPVEVIAATPAEPIEPPGIVHELPSRTMPFEPVSEQPSKKSKASISSEKKAKSKASIFSKGSKGSQGSTGSQASHGSHGSHGSTASHGSHGSHGKDSKKSSITSAHSKKLDRPPKRSKGSISSEKSIKSEHSHKKSTASVDSHGKSKLSLSSQGRVSTPEHGSKKSIGSIPSVRVSTPADELPTLVEEPETNADESIQEYKFSRSQLLQVPTETEANKPESPLATHFPRSRSSRSSVSTASEMSNEQLESALAYHSGSMERAASHIFVDHILHKTSTDTLNMPHDTGLSFADLEKQDARSDYTMNSMESFAPSEDTESVIDEDHIHDFKSSTPASAYTPRPLPLSLCHTPVSPAESAASLIVSRISVIHLESQLSPFQRDPTDDEKCAFTRSYGRIFGCLNEADLKAARQVCWVWNHYSGETFKKKMCFVFDPEDTPPMSKVTDSLYKIIVNPWLLLAPEKSSQFLQFLETSEKKLKPWNSFRIHSATSTDIKFLIQDKQMEAELRKAVKSITCLEINTCFIEWDTLFTFLHCFSHLEELIDIHNVYYEAVPLHIQVFRTLSGGTISPRTHHTHMDQSFIQKFKKYRFRWKRLKIQDTGLSTNTPLFMLCLKEALDSQSLEELELIAGGECKSCENQNGLEAVHFWLATGELLLHSGGSLQKLTVRCTHETAATTSFDNFVGSSLEYLNQTTNGNLKVLSHLTLDFSFLWLSHANVEKEFVPFITKLELLKNLTLRTIVMRPVYGERLEALKPLLPSCHYDFGVHVTDLEGGAAVPHVIRLVESSMYRSNMRNLHVSIHCPETVRFQQLMTERDEIQYTGLRSLTISIMNRHFDNLNITILPTKFPFLTELTITDGPPVYYLLGHHGLKAEKQYNRMSRAIFVDEDMQLLISRYPHLTALCLQLNMESLTDTALTGISPKCIKRMAFLRDMKIQEPEYEITGHCIGDLHDLRSLVLKGLGPWITDISAKLAFIGPKKLQTLVLGGKQRISKDGKAHLIAKFPKEMGYTLKILG